MALGEGVVTGVRPGGGCYDRRMDPTAAVSLAIATLLASPPAFVDVHARFEPPASAGAEGAVVVTLTPVVSAVVVNEMPSPRLTLDPQQKVLVDRQPKKASGGASVDPEHTKALDPKVPVRFPVAIAADAARGTHAVKATVIYFFCSKAEGWCRKGKTEIELAVSVP
jgi:hypothetical protein